MEKSEQIIKDAQYRKGLSIAYFNSLNAAIELVTFALPPNTSEVAVRDAVARWRDWFLSEHETYYATVIARIGVPYNVVESIEKLKATKNLAELKKVWLNFSEDERQDEEIIKVTNQIKKSYEEPQSTTKE